MSAETELRALLTADASLTALVGNRIAQNAVPQDEDYPLVVFTSAHAPSLSTFGTVLADEVTFSIQCWAVDSIVADAVADAATAALAARADVLGREAAYEEEMNLHATVLTVQWWTT